MCAKAQCVNVYDSFLIGKYTFVLEDIYVQGKTIHDLCCNWYRLSWNIVYHTWYKDLPDKGSLSIRKVLVQVQDLFQQENYISWAAKEDLWLVHFKSYHGRGPYTSMWFIESSYQVLMLICCFHLFIFVWIFIFHIAHFVERVTPHVSRTSQFFNLYFRTNQPGSSSVL